MSTERDIIVKILRNFASKINNAPDEKIIDLMSNDFEIVFTKNNSKRNKKSTQNIDLDTSNIEQTLISFDSREEGMEYLAEKCQRKDELELLVRHLDLPVSKKDSIEKLREKVIEATIGYRLRSKAIQSR